MVAPRLAPSLLLAALLALACGTAVGATIYKCFDQSLGVLYTDQPCRGEALDIQAGAPDPAAVAELAREREALSRSMAQRITDNRRTANERDFAYYGGPVPDVATPAAYVDVGYPGYYGFGVAPYATDKGPRRDGKAAAERRERARTVPNPPPGLPRR